MTMAIKARRPQLANIVAYVKSYWPLQKDNKWLKQKYINAPYILTCIAYYVVGMSNNLPPFCTRIQLLE